MAAANRQPATGADACVSVIIPCYNAARHVGAALESVLRQTCAPLEIIVVDDGSFDDTVPALDPYADRIQLLRQANAGPAAARNRGLAAARGEFVIFHDSDDRMRPGNLADHLAVIADDPSLDLTCGGVELFDETVGRSQVLEPWQGSEELTLAEFLRRHPFYLPAMMFRRSVVSQAGGFDLGLRQAEDVDLILRIMAAGACAAWVRKITVDRCLHGSNLTRRTAERVQCVTRVFDAFFARPDLGPEIAAMEHEVQHNVLMWSAWRLYRAGEREHIPQYLARTREHLGSGRHAVLHDWLSRIRHFAGEDGAVDPARALGDFLPLCRRAFELGFSAQEDVREP